MFLWWRFSVFDVDSRVLSSVASIVLFLVVEFNMKLALYKLDMEPSRVRRISKVDKARVVWRENDPAWFSFRDT